MDSSCIDDIVNLGCKKLELVDSSFLSTRPRLIPVPAIFGPVCLSLASLFAGFSVRHQNRGVGEYLSSTIISCYQQNGFSMMSENNESTELLRKRVYFAARDGLAITLYALLSERNDEEQKDLLSQVLNNLFHSILSNSFKSLSINKLNSMIRSICFDFTDPPSPDVLVFIYFFSSQKFEEQGQKCSPLLIAARDGKENVIKMLLDKFSPDIEQEGDVKFDGYLIEGASPLWCAAGNTNT